MARMRFPNYMFEGVGAMPNMVDAIEARMLSEFSRKLDSQGITNRGVRVPVNALEGLGSLGRFKFGQNIKNLAKTISGKTQSKAAKAANIVKAADKQGEEAARKLASIPNTAVNAQEKKGLTVAVKAAMAIRRTAVKEAAAPTITKQEIIEAAKPQIHAAAVAAATGAQKGVSQVMRRKGMFPQTNIRAINNELIQRKVAMSPLLPFNAIPASSYEDEVDVSGFGDVGADITSGADAFGADVSSGADAFGADITDGATAFGADVSSGADAFGYLGADEAAAAAESQPGPIRLDTPMTAAEQAAASSAPIRLDPKGSGWYGRSQGGMSAGKIAAIGALAVGGIMIAKKMLKR